MKYRATPLAIPFVQALNSIDLEFRSNDKRDNAIRDAWTNLLDHFSNEKGQPDFNARSQALVISLLSVMGTALGFEFNEAYLKRHSTIRWVTNPSRMSSMSFASCCSTSSVETVNCRWQSSKRSFLTFRLHLTTPYREACFVIFTAIPRACKSTTAP